MTEAALPTGTVTLLLADVEGSTRLWQTRPEEMTAAIARLDRTLAEVVTVHSGVRPVEQGEGDSFVVAFPRASDAVACALALQVAALAPLRLRIGVHTGEVRLRDEGNYIGPTINRTARLRDLAHGGQTVLSGTTSDVVVDELPEGAWLVELGSHALRDLPRPERVVQLCHPDLCNEFPPLRTATTALAAHHLPAQLTSFVGRESQIAEVRGLLTANRLVTLTGAGGAGKTRLAVQVATQLAEGFADGVWYVDLAPITHPDIVAVAVARTVGLPDQRGRSTIDTLTTFFGQRQTLVVLDNCEHLLDACASLVVELLGVCPALTVLATSREPLGAPGEVTFPVPSLSLADEAVELFVDRARRVRPDFRVTDDNGGTVVEICCRLDGMPLAIELAAARVRALSLADIVGGLHDRFRLLTGGARTAVRRQQTLRASVDWSHGLLTEPERILFRRLAVFLAGFDIEAAQAVAGDAEMERYQVLDQLALLVDKSLVIAEDIGGPTRYRMLETIRHYALEKLGESGESDTVRSRHRDHYAAMAASLDTASTRHAQRLEQIEVEIDNLRSAFAWSRESGDIERAMRLASSLQPLWLARGRAGEGLAWFDVVLDNAVQCAAVPPGVYARALADRALLDAAIGGVGSMERATHALAMAREHDDPGLLARALVACGSVASHDGAVAGPYFAEALGVAHDSADPWLLSQILAWQAYAAYIAGEPLAARSTAEEGLELADAIGDGFSARHCRWVLGMALMSTGDLAASLTHLRELAAEAEDAHDVIRWNHALAVQAYVLARQGDWRASVVVAETVGSAARELGPVQEGLAYALRAFALIAGGDITAAAEASAAARQRLQAVPAMTAVVNINPVVEIALARCDFAEARRLADVAVATATAVFPMQARTTRARVALAQGEDDRAARDLYEALARAATTGAVVGLPNTLECLAGIAGRTQRHAEAARLFGAADAVRQRTGEVRFAVHQADYDIWLGAVRDAMEDNEFHRVWAEGAALSTEEAIAYAQRGRGERRRPASGWDSLTPAESDVVRLVSDGLPNKDIAARLFISPRTVETHLGHVYAKLGLASRVQLVREAVRHR